MKSSLDDGAKVCSLEIAKRMRLIDDEESYFRETAKRMRSTGDGARSYCLE